MTVSNAEVAAELGRLAQLLQSQGENRFKIKAYQTAAAALKQYPRRVNDLVREGQDLTVIPGVGKGISGAIAEIVNSGQLAKVRTLSKELAPGTLEIAEAAGLKLKEAERAAKKLRISSPDELREKLESGELRTALGTRFEFKVRNGLAKIKRMLWWDAEDLAESLSSFIESVPGVRRVAIAGGFRRRKETVGSLRFVVDCGDSKIVAEAARSHGGVEEVIEEKGDRISFRLSAGPLFVLRFATAGEWGDALVAETGSAGHYKRAKRLAAKKDCQAESEEQWYSARGLDYIEPELREDRGEVEAAARHTLPELIRLEEIRGDLHAHSTASDGSNTIAEMVRAARSRGYQYLAITDHSQSLRITNGLDSKRLLKQIDDIAAMNDRLQDFRILTGSEVDILEDGTLDFPDDVLERLDIVICSIHSKFQLNKRKQTDRLLRALENPHVTIVGHLTGRLLLKRPGYEVDTDAVLRRLQSSGKSIEINSSPDRLDIDDILAMRARELELKVAINTDAHSIRELDFIRLGVQQARRGWLSKAEVLNAMTLRQLLSYLRQRPR